MGRIVKSNANGRDIALGGDIIYESGERAGIANSEVTNQEKLN
jgi:hypothetical protein